MKIDRLIGIITVLQKNKKVTAPCLAERFEVSRRTIGRDIEDICRAGIPIVTTQGEGGGISLMEGFCLDTTVFTEEELSVILTGLKSIESVSRTPHASIAAQKINGGIRQSGAAENITIDLSSFYKDDLAGKIALLNSAVRDRRRVAFHYYYSKGEADKLIEPYQIAFKWSDWYVFGFCTGRQDFRMYKLRRLWRLRVCDEVFEVRELPEENKRFGSHMTDDYFITAIYDPSVKYRLVEEYGPDSFTVLEDGRLRAKRGFTDPDEAVLWFLGFGDKAEVTAPPEMVEKMRQAIEKIAEKYHRT